MQKQIKDYKREVDDLSNRIKQCISYFKEKENESGSSVCVMQWTRFISDVTLI
jgi:hypothetical protein